MRNVVRLRATDFVHAGHVVSARHHAQAGRLRLLFVIRRHDRGLSCGDELRPTDVVHAGHLVSARLHGELFALLLDRLLRQLRKRLQQLRHRRLLVLRHGDCAPR